MKATIALQTTKSTQRAVFDRALVSMNGWPLSCSLMKIDERAITKSVNTTRRTIDSEDKTDQGALP